MIINIGKTHFIKGKKYTNLGTNRMVNDPQHPKLITRIQDKKITDISCGVNHTLALDDEGQMYTWGYAAYGRLGLNETPPKDSFTPSEIGGFKDRSNPVKKIATGATCSMCIDSRDSLYLWGKWKNSGDGGQGTPWLYPKHFQGLSGWILNDIAAGQNHLFATSDASTVSWGIFQLTRTKLPERRTGTWSQ